MKKRIIIGISGASGVIYGIRALQHLAEMDTIESHLIISDGAALNIAVETDFKVADVKAMADVVHSNDNLAAGIASGSYRADAMAVVPCSIKTLSGIANSYADNLLVRAADVTLKERRPLILMVRETPLHKGHLELMTRAADYGAVILPPVPAFYQQPASVTEIVDQSVGKLFDCLDIEHDLMRRWGGKKTKPTSSGQ
ncbi:UbiX family flavin prenyltransferase [Halieaceae bacterium IMCC14734]|uniref:Flavin prenyltransferase UbiX n=1 Tax=Candidatus Litorirhabdus singularis TaxID=2518993 RepID=A0ABT3TJM2_9GAMM|nr:UbiX family flavin prenyltransferase [Candidatus Litorirhabdus singularis]MCX2981976.1 UbiX family flavin prenyltransferase [Candidatus Litorirhabdus singularis]